MSYDQNNDREQSQMPELELLIQRLVDGEVDSQQRIALLKLAESQPEIYRLIAIRFIETQSLSQLLAGEPFELMAPGANPGMIRANAVNLTEPKSTTVSRDERLRWFAIAAVLLIGLSFWGGAFLAGKFRDGIGGDDGAMVEIANGLSDSVVTTSDSGDKADSLGPMVESNQIVENIDALAGEMGDGFELNGNSLDQSQLAFDATNQSANSRLRLVRELDGNRQSMDLPVVELPSVNRDLLLGNREEVINDLQRELARFGIFMSYESTVIDGSLPDGRRVLVPFRNVNYQSIGY